MIIEDGGIEREPDKRGEQEAGACQAQSGMGHAMEEPEQRGAFHRPADGDPLALELNREYQGDEEQRDAAKPGQLRHPGRAGSGDLLQHHYEA